MDRLRDTHALVTGAARGIGLAIARAFIDEGATVLLTDINDELGAEQARRLGDRAAYARLDVTREQDWASVLTPDARVRVLVNNAGVTGFDQGPEAHDPEHATLDAWERVHATNLRGVFLGCRQALRTMRLLDRASIINIASRSGVVGVPRAAAYASSKAAVRNHTKSVALYAAEERLGVRCNAILPAAVLTPMWDPMLAGPDRDAAIESITRDIPLRRFATPDEVAALAVFLASDESSYCTGADFTLDGGMLAGAASPPPPAD